MNASFDGFFGLDFFGRNVPHLLFLRAMKRLIFFTTATIFNLNVIAQSFDSLYALKGSKKCFYANYSGARITDEKFTLTKPFSNKLAVASDKSYSGLFPPLQGLITPKGDWFVNPVYDEIGDFTDGVAPFKIKGKWGLLNNEGLISMPARFDHVDFIGSGYCGIDANYKWGYSDYFGNVKIAPVYTQITPFEGNFAMVRMGSRWLMINKSGKQAVASDWDYAGAFSEGLAPTKYSGGLWAYIDTSGKRVIQAAFKDARPFKEQRAAVRINEYWGFIDRSGKVVVSAVYSKVDDFSEGYSAVYYKGKWGFVDRYGKVAVRAVYSSVEPFRAGLARVKDGSGRAYYINPEGLIVLSE